MINGYVRNAMVTVVATAALLAPLTSLTNIATLTQPNVAVAATQSRSKKVINHTVTYNSSDWPESTLAAGTNIIDVPYQANYKMNWNQVVHYFYIYTNQLATLNGATPVQQDAATMKFAQHRALAQKKNDLSHDGSGNYGENLEFIDENAQSDQEEAYALVMGWYDETYNVIGKNRVDHYGHRANMLWGRGRTGLGWNPQYGQVSFDFTAISNEKRYDQVADNTGVDYTTVGLPKTVFRYYTIEK